MANSMTGFGRYENVVNSLKVCVEIKSVNHRFLDLNLKLPRKFSFFENEARNIIKNRISRGKVDVFFSFEEDAADEVEIHYHPEIAKKYYDGLMEMKEQFDLKDSVSVGLLARFPDVFTQDAKEEDQDELCGILSETLNKALDDFVLNRKEEGNRSDKICVDEELVRLKSHVKEARDTLTTKDEVGRKMDFLAQEMNRESNTLLSKSTDVKVADIGIELKTLIEKIREQIQNLE